MRGLALGDHYAKALRPKFGAAAEQFNFQRHLGSSAWHTAVWLVVLTVLFTVLAVRQYRKV
jgi:hypothetical protein